MQVKGLVDDNDESQGVTDVHTNTLKQIRQVHSTFSVSDDTGPSQHFMFFAVLLFLIHFYYGTNVWHTTQLL